MELCECCLSDCFPKSTGTVIHLVISPVEFGEYLCFTVSVIMPSEYIYFKQLPNVLAPLILVDIWPLPQPEVTDKISDSVPRTRIPKL